jgi:hypothetical protein
MTDHQRPGGATPAAIFIPGHDLRLEMSRTLLHCDQRGYRVLALGVGERSWPSIVAMYQSGQCQKIVTTTRAGHSTEPGVELAGGGRVTVRTPARAQRVRQISDLIDSGLSTEEIVRILRR